MGDKYLIDTNVVIDLLGNRFSENAIDWIEGIIERQEHCISAINKIELLSFNGNSDEMNTLEAFISECKVLAINDKIIDTTISLRRTKNIKLPGAVIAATVKEHQLTIISRNVKDFKPFLGNNIINPYDM